jgi:hypothetical protein
MKPRSINELRRAMQSGIVASQQRQQDDGIAQAWDWTPGGLGGTTEFRRAFVKTQPTSGTTLTVYLDSYSPPGAEVSVTCDIYDDAGTGGSFTDDTMPNPIIGCPLLVWKDGSSWRNLTPIFALEEC